MSFIFDDIAMILLAVSAASTVASAYEGQQSSKSNKRAQESQRAQQNYRAAQERRQAIRQQRIAYASAQQNAENQGVGTSSGAFGGQGSIQTQGNVNLSFLDNNMAFANQTGGFLDSAASHSANSNLWGSLSQLAMTTYQTGWFDAPTPNARIPGQGSQSYAPKPSNYNTAGPSGFSNRKLQSRY